MIPTAILLGLIGGLIPRYRWWSIPVIGIIWSIILTTEGDPTASIAQIWIGAFFFLQDRSARNDMERAEGVLRERPSRSTCTQQGGRSITSTRSESIRRSLSGGLECSRRPRRRDLTVAPGGDGRFEHVPPSRGACHHRGHRRRHLGWSPGTPRRCRFEDEHAAYGIDLPPLKRRFDRRLSFEPMTPRRSLKLLRPAP